MDMMEKMTKVIRKGGERVTVMRCPECGSPNYQPSGGCAVCMDCGYSKCG